MRNGLFWSYLRPDERERLLARAREEVQRCALSSELPDWTSEAGLNRFRGNDLADADTDDLRAEHVRLSAELGRLLPLRPRRAFVAPGVVDRNGADAIAWLRRRAEQIRRELRRRAA